MKLRLPVLFVAVLAVLVLGAVPVKAENVPVHSGQFASHIDLAQLYQEDGKTGVLVMGYHFTALRFGRFRTLGLGVAVGTRRLVNVDPHDYVTSAYKGEFLVTVPVAGFRVTTAKDPDNPDLYFNAQYAYNVSAGDHIGTIGFSLAW